MLSLQAAEAAAAGNKSIYNTPDPLCMSNASLHALQNLQPWADDYDDEERGSASSCTSPPPPQSTVACQPPPPFLHQLAITVVQQQQQQETMTSEPREFDASSVAC